MWNTCLLKLKLKQTPRVCKCSRLFNITKFTCKKLLTVYLCTCCNGNNLYYSVDQWHALHGIVLQYYPWAPSLYKDRLSQVWDSHVKDKTVSQETGIHILVKRHLYIETPPDSKVHEANMGLTWVLSAPGWPQVGPRLATLTLPSGTRIIRHWDHTNILTHRYRNKIPVV